MEKIRAHNLKCEYFTNPLGIDVPFPRFSWQIFQQKRGAAQSAYRIFVSLSPDEAAAGRGEIWDSGVIASGQCTSIEYRGLPLKSRTRYYWSVLLYDLEGYCAYDSGGVAGLLDRHALRGACAAYTPGIYAGKGDSLRQSVYSGSGLL